MKFSTNRLAMLSALKLVQNVIPLRSPKEILLGCKLNATENGVTVIGTDTSARMATKVVADVATPGKVVVPHARLTQLLSSVTGENVFFELKDTMLAVRSEMGTIKLATMPESDYPPYRQVAASYTMSIRTDDIAAALSLVTPVCERVGGEWASEGLMLAYDNGAGYICSMDNAPSRSAVYKLDTLDGALEDGQQLLLHFRAGRTVAAVCRAAKTESVSVSGDSNSLCVNNGETQYITSLLAGRLPKLKFFLKHHEGTTFTVNAAALASGCKAVAVTLNEESLAISLKCDSQGELALATTTPSLGNSDVRIPIVGGGESLKRLNGHLLTDILGRIDGEVKCTFADGEGPVVIECGKVKYTIATLEDK